LLRKSIVEMPASIVRDGWPPPLFKTCASAARLKNHRDFNALYVLQRIKWIAIHAILKGKRSNSELRIDLLNWGAEPNHEGSVVPREGGESSTPQPPGSYY
jgi:hypothetical protein